MPSVYLLFGILAMVLFVVSLLFETYIIIIVLEILALLAFFVFYRKQHETLIAAAILLIGTLITWFGISYFRPETSKTLLVLAGLLISSVLFLIQMYKHKLKTGFFILLVLETWTFVLYVSK